MNRKATNRQRIDVEPLEVARKLFGFQSFRPGQEEATRAVLDGQDVFAVLPTGAGKSAIYQIAASVMPGPTVVVSPLIALQSDQAQKLETPEAGGAAVVNSSVAVTKQREAFDELEHEVLEFIFLAPEQLRRQEVLARLRDAEPSLFVVDEAHCISEWGHDFRPDYLRLGTVIEALGHPRVLALTATAPPRIRDEIVERLAMRSPRIVIGDMDRPNIRLEVHESRTAAAKERNLLAAVEAAEPPGIVYVATRRHAEDVAARLAEAGANAVFYHGGMNKNERESTHADFMEGRAKIVVATSAFGMGVDKPDVRFVFHFDVPASLEAYYQEFGRAGRDGKPARARLFYRPEDLSLHKFFAAGGRLDAADLESVAEAVRAAGRIDEESLRQITKLPTSKLTKATVELLDQGLVERSLDGALRAAADADFDEAADVMLERQERHRAHLLRSLDRMRMYAELQDCRRRYLLDYFGQEIEPCGRCDNCDERPRADAAGWDEQPFPVRTRIAHKKLGKGMVLGYAGARVRILFEGSGEKALDTKFAIERGLLERA